MLHSFTYGHVANPEGNAHATKCKTGVPFVVQLDLTLRFPVIIMMVMLLLIYDDDDNATGDSKSDGEDNDKQNDNSNHKSSDDELVN